MLFLNVKGRNFKIPFVFICLFFIFGMNKRFIVIGVFLGIVISIAFFIGCPNKTIGCLAFDIGR